MDFEFAYAAGRIRTTPQDRRTIPYHTGFGPDEWFYSVVVVLVGSYPGGE